MQQVNAANIKQKKTLISSTEDKFDYVADIQI